MENKNEQKNKTESRGVNSYRLRNNYFIVCSFQMWYNVFIHFSFQLYCSPFRCVFSHFPSIILLVSSRMLYTTAYIAFIRDGDYCVVFAFFGYCLYEFKKIGVMKMVLTMSCCLALYTPSMMPVIVTWDFSIGFIFASLKSGNIIYKYK